MTQNYEIKNRFTGAVLFTYEVPEGMKSRMIARHAVETAIANGVILQDADFRGADFRGAHLRSADFRGANFRSANFWGADLQDADIQGADFRGANFWDADFQGADFRDADLQGADIQGADFRGAKNVPLIITGLHWPICIDGTGKMRIGCQEHSVEAWKNFTDDEIKRMDRNALEFWNKYKGLLLKACEDHVHTVEVSA